jgi:hypothetical protein
MYIYNSRLRAQTAKESEFHPRWEICGQYVTAVYCCADTGKKGSASIK